MDLRETAPDVKTVNLRQGSAGHRVDRHELGAELVTVDPVSSRTLPQVDGLYVGGGFPEVHAARLADNVGLAADLRRRVASGLPVYAECGGLMYLARELRTGGATYPMAAVLDLVVEQTPRPCLLYTSDAADE